MKLESVDDPLKILHSDVFDLIFQHFSHCDLLLSSEVSWLWYKSIGESPKSMKNLNINFTHRNASCDLGLGTERQYRNICADLSHYSKEDVLNVLSQSQHNWRQIKLFNGYFETEVFLETFSETIQTLSLNRIEMKTKVTEENNSKFPRLEQLEIFSSNDKLLVKFVNCSTLKTFHFSETSIGDERKHFSQVLVNNEKLTKLTMFVDSVEKKLPLELNPKIKFHLQNICIGISHKTTEDDWKCLNEFLMKQSTSLTVISITSWFGLDVLATCLKMPKLTDLSFSFAHNDEIIDWKNVILPTNASINRLNISSQQSNDFYDVIFNSTPNLKTYKAEQMNIDNLNSLSQRCINLEELYIENFDVPLLPKENIFPKLKKFKTWDVNEDLMKNLKVKSSRNHFEDLIFNF